MYTMYTYVYIYMYTMYTYVHICNICVHMYMYTMYTNVHICVHMYTLYTYTHVHICTHIYTYICVQALLRVVDSEEGFEALGFKVQCLGLNVEC